MLGTRPLLFALVLLSAACSRTPQSYLEAGNRQFNAQSWAEAVLSYRAAIKADPNFGEAYYRLGLAYIQQNQSVEAFTNLRSAAELLPDRSDVQAEYGRVVLGAYLSDPTRGQPFYQTLTKLAADMLQRDARSADGRRIQGFLALSDRKPERAVELFRQALALRPGDPDLTLALGRALIEAGQGPEGEGLLVELTRNSPKFAPTYDFLFRQYRSTQRIGEAEAILKAKLAQLPGDVSARLQLADFYGAAQRLAEVEETLAPLRKGGAPERVQLGDFYLRRGGIDRALREYQDGLNSFPADAMVFRDRLDQALRAAGRLSEAAQIWEAALAQKSDNLEARRARDAAWIDGGKAAEAIADLQALAGQQPEDGKTHYELARGFRQLRQLDAAAKEFREAARLMPADASPLLGLSEISISQGQFDAALRAASDAGSRGPAGPAAGVLRATALMGLRRGAEARTELRTVLEAWPDDIGAQLQMGLLDLAERRFSEAEATFRRLYRPGQTDRRAAEGLAELFFATGQPAKALELWRAEVKRSPDATQIRLRLAADAIRAGKPAEAIAEYEQLLRQEPRNESLIQGLAEAHRLNGDPGRAEAILKQGGGSAPASRNTALAFLQQKRGSPEAEAGYRRALASRPDDAVAANNLAFFLADAGKSLDEALVLAEKARRAQPSNPEFVDTLGWVQLKRGAHDKAELLFRDLAAANPQRPGFRYHWALALLARGDKPQAKVQLERALKANPDPEEGALIRKLLVTLN